MPDITPPVGSPICSKRPEATGFASSRIDESGGNVRDGRCGRCRHWDWWRRPFSYPQGDRVRADALRATDRPRLLITSATPSAAHPRQLWREKHEISHSVGSVVGPARRDSTPGANRGLDQSGDDDKGGQVQRSRQRELGERTQPPMRQPRRARRERVEMKHDERSRKADTDGA